MAIINQNVWEMFQFQNQIQRCLQAFPPLNFSFPIPILSAAPNSIIYRLRINRLYAVKEKEKRKKAHLILFSVFALS